MPTAETSDDVVTAQPESKKPRGRTRVPPKTLPADFDFGSQSTASTAPTTAPTAGANAPPKTLPADFDFDTGSHQQSNPSHVDLAAFFHDNPDVVRKLDALPKDPEKSHKMLESVIKPNTPVTDDAWYKSLPWFSRAISSFEENFGVPASVQRNPVEALQGIGSALRHPGLEMDALKQMYEGLNKDQQEIIDRAYQLQHAPSAASKANGFVMGVYASVPVFGPAIVHAVDKWNSGDKAGAVGALAALGTQFAAPEAGKIHPIEMIKKAGSETAARIVSKAESTSSKLQTGLQHAAGTGPRLAEKVTKKAVAEVQSGNEAAVAKAAKAEAKHAEALTDHETKLSRINEDFDDKIAKTKQQYADDVAARDKKVSELQTQHADKVAEARREWVEKTHEARESTREQAKVEGKREALKSAQKRYAELIRENVKDAHTNVRAGLDKRWNQLREAVGTEHPVSPSGIYDAVEKSRAMLAGVPADLKIFNDVFKEITEPDTFVESPDGPKPAPKEYITFDNARTQYSAIGEKAYGADGNLRRALFNVYDAYDQALSKTATDAGAGKQYAAVKRDWSQYMKDWHDMSSAATGGSPLARVYRAVDNPVVTAHVMSKFGDRLFGTFAKYDKFGANPSLLSKLRNNVQETTALPKVKTIKEPGKFESPGGPKLPEPVEEPHGKISDIESQRTKTLERTEPPVPVKPPALTSNPTVAEMVDTLRRAKQEKAKDFAAGQKWHPYDLIMGSWVAFGLPDALVTEGLSRATVHAAMYFGVRVGWMKFVKSPMGMEWMTKVTPADIDMISKTLAQAPEERAELGKAVTETLEDTVRAGGPPPNIAKFNTLLTPEQQREVMRTVKDINELKARGIKPPDVTAQANTEGRVVGTSRVPESSAEAGGSGTAAGAAADNTDIAQARKNLGIAPGQWDTRLLSEAQKIKDSRLGGSKQAPQGLPSDFKTVAEAKVNGINIEMLDSDSKSFGSIGIRSTELLGHQASEVGDIQIDATRRGKGYGQALYQKAAEYAKSNGDDFLLSSGKPTKEAMASWQRLKSAHPEDIEFADGRWRWNLRNIR